MYSDVDEVQGNWKTCADTVGHSTQSNRVSKKYRIK